jgi:3-oxoadipate enol-lactonase
VEGYLGSCVAIRDADYTSVISKITVPTLCLVGEKDVSTPPEQVRSLAESIPGASFRQIQGAGHFPCLEAPAEMAAAIREFMSSILT